MFEQLLGLRIIRRQLQGPLNLRPREIRLFLLEVDFRQHRSNHCGIAGLQRSLQFLHSIIYLALVPVNFGQPPMSRCASRSGSESGTELFFCGISAPRGKFLPATSNVPRRRVARRRISGARGRHRRHNLRAKSRYVELGLDANQPRCGFVFRIQADRGKPFGAKCFIGRLPFLVGLRFLARLFQRQNHGPPGYPARVRQLRGKTLLLRLRH